MHKIMVITLLLALAGTSPSDAIDDSFEPNDTCESATLNAISVGATTMDCYLGTSNDDWYEYVMESGDSVTLQTTDGTEPPFAADTIIDVFDSDCSTILTSNDDIDASGGNYYSAVTLNFPANTVLYIRVSAGSHDLPEGSYNIECYSGTVAGEDGTWSRIKSVYR